MGTSKLELYRFIDELHLFLNLDYDSFPLNTINICTTLHNTEIQYHDFNTNGFCAAVLLGDKSDTMILNAARKPDEMNFDCGHELIHASKHRGMGIRAFSCMEMKLKRKDYGFLEWEANEGSAQLLVPHYSILPEIKKVYPYLNSRIDFLQFKNEMAFKYGVSEAVINFRFESLKYEIEQYLQGVSLNGLRVLSNHQQQVRGIRIKSLNDKEMELFEAENHQHHFDKRALDIFCVS